MHAPLATPAAHIHWKFGAAPIKIATNNKVMAAPFDCGMFFHMAGRLLCLFTRTPSMSDGYLFMKLHHRRAGALPGLCRGLAGPRSLADSPPTHGLTPPLSLLPGPIDGIARGRMPGVRRGGSRLPVQSDAITSSVPRRPQAGNAGSATTPKGPGGKFASKSIHTIGTLFSVHFPQPSKAFRLPFPSSNLYFDTLEARRLMLQNLCCS